MWYKQDCGSNNRKSIPLTKASLLLFWNASTWIINMAMLSVTSLRQDEVSQIFCCRGHVIFRYIGNMQDARTCQNGACKGIRRGGRTGEGLSSRTQLMSMCPVTNRLSCRDRHFNHKTQNRLADVIYSWWWSSRRLHYSFLNTFLSFLMIYILWW